MVLFRLLSVFFFSQFEINLESSQLARAKTTLAVDTRVINWVSISSFDLNMHGKMCNENSKQLQIKHQMRDE